MVPTNALFLCINVRKCLMNSFLFSVLYIGVNVNILLFSFKNIPSC